MDIKAPYGAQEIIPLTKTHRVALPDTRKPPPAFRGLNALPARKPKELAQSAVLARIYAHIMSLADVGRLLDRRAVSNRATAAKTR